MVIEGNKRAGVDSSSARRRRVRGKGQDIALQTQNPAIVYQQALDRYGQSYIGRDVKAKDRAFENFIKVAMSSGKTFDEAVKDLQAKERNMNSRHFIYPFEENDL